MTSSTKPINIALLSPPNRDNRCYVSDWTEALCYSLLRLGYHVSVSHNELRPEARNIIWGLQDRKDLSLTEIPSDSIIYNLEPAAQRSKCLRKHYLQAMSRFETWDYSRRNVTLLSEQYGIDNIKFVPPGYAPEITRLNPEYPKDIDVLFYGSLQPRRLTIIEKLKAMGLRVTAMETLYGKKRDLHIARSKVVLNMHGSLPGVLEVVRVNYLLANRAAVVAERNDDTEVSEFYEGACAYAPYDALAEKVKTLLDSQSLRASQAQAGFSAFSGRPYTGILKAALDDRASPVPVAPPLPRKLSVFTGLNFRPDCLTSGLPGQEEDEADLCLDWSKPLEPDASCPTRLYGSLRLKSGMFKSIHALDVLQLMPNIPQAMSNFLYLLETGGKLHFRVPYDLSYGAWSSPYAVRAFNEHTWTGIEKNCREGETDGCCFKVESISFELGSFGKRLEKLCRLGIKAETIRKIPRAVEFMSGVLVKQCRASGFAEIPHADVPLYAGGADKNLPQE